MKRIATILPLLLLLCSLLHAGDFVIGSGSSTEYYVPFNGYYNYGWSKFLFTNTEMANAGFTGTTTIKRIAFQVGNDVSNYLIEGQHIYMGVNYNTSYGSSATGFPALSGMTEVFSGSITWNGPGWVEIPLDTPYNYNSTWGLEIAWTNYDGTKLGGYPKFCYTPASNTCVYKYDNTTFPTSSGSRNGNRPNIWFMSDPATVPPAANLISPANNATGVNITSSVRWFHSGGLPDYYTVNFGTDNPPTNILNSYQTTDIMYTPESRLDYGTDYYIQIIPHNSFGDATSVPVYTFRTLDDPSIVSFPYTENFDTAVPPNSNWQISTGALQDPVVLSPTSIFQSDDWQNISGTDKAAAVTIWGAVNAWLITPLINIPNNNFYLAFDFSLLKENQTPTGTPPVYAPDDRFVVLIGDGFSWSTANIVREWNNSGSPYVLANTALTGERFVIPLNGHTGRIKIAFYAGSTVSNASNDFMINNLVVGEYTALPAVCSNPSPADTAVGVLANPTLSWNNASDPMVYKVYLGNPLPETYATTDVRHFQPSNLAFGSTYNWKVVPVNALGDAESCPEWSFTTINSTTIDAGTVTINEVPVNPSVTIDGMAGVINPTAVASYAPDGIGLPNVGLVLNLSCEGSTLAGTTITINHNLGFVPSQIAYRIAPAMSYNAISNPGTWTSSTITINISAKADGNIQIVFPVDGNSTLPVELSYFNATFCAGTYVQLAWISESETNHSGYNILRGLTNELKDAVKINPLLISNGTENGSQTAYEYSDLECEMNSHLYYWLESVSLDGASQFMGPISVLTGTDDPNPSSPDIPVVTKLLPAFPNPFNPNTNLRYTITNPGHVVLDIFNARGQLVRSFSQTHTTAGTYQTAWDGKDASGRLVSSGIYMCRMKSGSYSDWQKMVLMK